MKKLIPIDGFIREDFQKKLDELKNKLQRDKAANQLTVDNSRVLEGEQQ